MGHISPSFASDVLGWLGGKMVVAGPITGHTSSSIALLLGSLTTFCKAGHSVAMGEERDWSMVTEGCLCRL